jgi:hypothetical protein
MTQISPHLANPAYLQIEDRLDAIGQKYRVQKIVRGAMLWVAAGVLASLAAALTAHFLGAGAWARIVLVVWAAWLAGSAIAWFVRPLLIHLDPVQIARLVESRVGGLHNGLTNSLLLARRDDLADSPWLPQIYDEILSTSGSVRLSDAVKMRDLRPLATWLGGIVLLALAATAVFQRPLRHGWQQLFSPTQFVPKLGAAEITDVKPGDTRVVTGQVLDLTVLAEAPRALGQPPMKIIFEAATGAGVDPGYAAVALPAGGDVLPNNVADVDGRPDRASLRYTYHVDHLGRPVRYRVEVAGTQSRWYSADVIKKVELEELALRVTAPLYTGQETRVIRIKTDDLARTPVMVPQGSRVDVYQVKFENPEEIAKEEKQQADELRQKLREFLDTQKNLNTQAVAAKPQDHAAFTKVGAGQTDLRPGMKQTAETFKFEPEDRVVQKALLMLVLDPATQAVDISALLSSEPDPAAQRKEDDDL